MRNYKSIYRKTPNSFRTKKKPTCLDSQIIVILTVFCYLTSYFLISKISSSQFVTHWSLHESFDLLVNWIDVLSFYTCNANNMKFYLFIFNLIEIQISTIAQRAIRYLNDQLMVIFRNVHRDKLYHLHERSNFQPINKRYKVGGNMV